MKQLTYKAWTRKAGSSDKWTTTEIKAKNKSEAKRMLTEIGLEIDGKIYN